MARGVAGWRALGLFWAILLVAAAGGAAALQLLGPPSHGLVAMNEASAAHPAETSGPAQGHEAPPPAAAMRRVAGPDAALAEHLGPLTVPKVGPDGRSARIAYAAPVPTVPTGTPRIALLLSGFGLTERESRAAVDTLPGPVSFAVSANAAPAAALLEAARLAGHELLASIPMEPQGYPLNDEGAHSLLTGLTPGENQQYLDWSLSRTQGAVGATGASDGMRGERFADVSGAFDPVLDELAHRGLLYIDPRPGRTIARPGLVARTVDVVLDDPPGRADIEAKLAALERLAREKGSAIGLAGPLRPVTIERIAAWTQTLEKRGFALVPVSTLTNP